MRVLSGLAAGLAVAILSLPAAPPARAGGPALAAEAMDVLQKYCVAHDARQIDVINAADEDGLLPGGPELTGGLIRSGDQSTIIRVRHVGAATVALIVKPRIEPGSDIQGMTLDTCTVGVFSALPAFSSAVRQWLGVPPLPGETDRYMYVDTEEGRQVLNETSEQDIEALAVKGGVRMVSIDQTARSTLVTYGVTRAAAPPAAAGPEAGQSPFADFRSLCVETGAQPAKVTEAATAGRWMMVPPADDRDLPWPFKTGEIRIKSTEQEFEVLIFGQGRAQLGMKIVEMTLCGIGQAPPNDTLLIKDVEDWIGGAPIEVDPSGGRLYLFTESNGVRTPLGPKYEAALVRKFKSEPVYFALLLRSSHTDDTALAALGRITKVSEF